MIRAAYEVYLPSKYKSLTALGSEAFYGKGTLRRYRSIPLPTVPAEVVYQRY